MVEEPVDGTMEMFPCELTCEETGFTEIMLELCIVLRRYQLEHLNDVHFPLG